MKIKLIAALIAASTFAATSANAEVEVSTKGGNLKISSGESNIQIGGRLMYDYNRSELNGVVDEDQFDDRRARLYVKGDVNKDWAYKLNFNLDGSGFEDLYVQYKGFGNAAKITIGNQRQPFGLQDQTSSNDISVLERSALAELFAPGRTEGVVLSGDLANNVYYGVGAFFEDVDENKQGEEMGFAGRVTWAPVMTKTSLIHFGLAYLDDGHESDAFGLEAAAVSGPFHIQAELDDGTISGNDVSGFYVQAGYILTGETRPYKGGKFKRVQPSNKAGAWEVVARYEDGDGNYSDIELGRTDATSLAVGVNYYANNNIRIGVNYTDGEDNINGDDGNEFRVRFGLAF
jgi:phosphate-selective porin OprO/OprP